jgi:hypothetical protein
LASLFRRFFSFLLSSGTFQYLLYFIFSHVLSLWNIPMWC